MKKKIDKVINGMMKKKVITEKSDEIPSYQLAKFRKLSPKQKQEFFKASDQMFYNFEKIKKLGLFRRSTLYVG